MVQLRRRSFMSEAVPLSINRMYHHAGKTPVRHDHDFVELVYVISGTAQHDFEGELFTIRAGDVFIINPGEQHTYLFDAGEEIEINNCLFLPSIISSSLLRELEITDSIDYFYVHPFLHPEERFNHRVNVRGDQAERVLSLLEGMKQECETRQPGAIPYIRLLLVQLLLLLSRHYSRMNCQRMGELADDRSTMLARRICGYIERNYEQKVTHELLSSVFHVSVRHVNRLVHRETGTSVVQYLHQIRIERAKHLLIKTDDKVADIAEQVGYMDPSFFGRLFVKLTGCSPGQYRTHYAQRNT